MKVLDALMQSGEKYNLIDARVTGQFDKKHIESAVNITQDKLRTEVETLDKDVVTVTYCNKGVTGDAV